MQDILLLAFQKNISYKASSFYQVLVGKQTVSILYWALTHESLPFMGFVPKLTKTTWQEFLDEAVMSGDLVETTPQVYTITKKGLDQKQKIYPEKVQYDGVFMRQQGVKYFQGLLLAVQVVSEYLHGEKRYLPIVTDQYLQQIMKQWFYVHINDVGIDFSKELSLILAEMAEEQANLLASQFSGYEVFGATTSQLQEQFRYESEKRVLFLMRESIYAFFKQVQISKNTPLLFDIYQRIAADFWVQNSAWQTYQLFLQGQTLEKIAQSRYLKISTVREHLIEIAIVQPNFPFEKIVTANFIETLLAQFSQDEIKSLTLAAAREKIADIEFFPLRLYQIQLQKGL